MKGLENRDLGVSLIELVIVVALGSVLVLIGSKAFDAYRFSTQTMEADEELLQVKTSIFGVLDCNSTVSRNDDSDNAGDPVDACDFDAKRCPQVKDRFLAVKSKLRDKKGVPTDLIPLFNPKAKEGPTKGYKRIALRAQCVCCDYCFSRKAVLVEYKDLSVKWGRWRPLFGDEKAPDGGIKLGCPVP